MEINELVILFEQNKDQDNALKQAMYLKNQFNFLGLAKPQRSELEKDFINSFKEKDISEIIDVAYQLNNLEEREYMYTAQQLLYKYSDKLTYKDLAKVVELTKHKSWWENTDGYNIVIKKYFKSNPKEIYRFVKRYTTQKNMWVRRLTIICQLGLADSTNIKALDLAIQSNINDHDFFIQKAIAWAIRDLSRHCPEVALDLFNRYQEDLDNFAKKEASKYLIKPLSE